MGEDTSPVCHGAEGASGSDLIRGFHSSPNDVIHNAYIPRKVVSLSAPGGRSGYIDPEESSCFDIIRIGTVVRFKKVPLDATQPFSFSGLQTADQVTAEIQSQCVRMALLSLQPGKGMSTKPPYHKPKCIKKV
jgi:hypothetical protein